MTLLKDRSNVDFDDVQFDVQRLARYNSARQRYYEFFSKVTSLLIIVLTAISGYLFSQEGEFYKFVFPVLIILISTLDLIYKPGKMAAIHDILTKHFIRLDMKMTTSKKKDESMAEHFLALRLEIDQDSPPDLEVASIISHNELCESLGYTEEVWHVNWVQKMFAQWGVLSPFLSPIKWIKLDDYNANKTKVRQNKVQQSPA